MNLPEGSPVCQVPMISAEARLCVKWRDAKNCKAQIRRRNSHGCLDGGRGRGAHRTTMFCRSSVPGFGWHHHRCASDLWENCCMGCVPLEPPGAGPGEMIRWFEWMDCGGPPRLRDSIVSCVFLGRDHDWITWIMTESGNICAVTHWNHQSQ